MIFPDLAGKKFGYINLNELAKPTVAGATMSIFLDPVVCQQFVEAVHEKLDLDWSYGGWLEDRSQLWRGSYLDEVQRHTHLGIDFNAPVGSRVYCDEPGKIILVDDDHPEVHGWGKRVFVGTQDGDVLIYAHMTAITVKAGDTIGPLTLLGRIAGAHENGGWYPHVHVQIIAAPEWGRRKGDVQELDGYGDGKDMARLAREFPDPLRYVRLR